MRPWSTFITGANALDYDPTHEQDRRLLVDLILEIADEFLLPTEDDQRVAQFGYDRGGLHYDLYDWLRAIGGPGPELPDVLLEEDFAASTGPSNEEIASALQRRNFRLLTPGTEQQVFRAWIGTKASQEIGCRLQEIELSPEQRDTPRAREDFQRLRRLLDRKLPKGILDWLATALFELSLELGHRELEHAHEPVVKAALERAARSARNS